MTPETATTASRCETGACQPELRVPGHRAELVRVGQIGARECHQQAVRDAQSLDGVEVFGGLPAPSPASAAITNITAGTGPTPASMLVTKRWCPGTSTNASWFPGGSSAVQA